MWATEDTSTAAWLRRRSLRRDRRRAERSAFHASFEPAGVTRIVPIAEAESILAPVYERVAGSTAGMFSRTSEWWRARSLADPHWRRRGGGEMQCVVVESGGAATAYALYRLNVAFDRGVQTGTVEVIEAMGDSPEATARCGGSCWTSTGWPGPRGMAADRPSLLLAAPTAATSHERSRRLWVRLVDVEAALARAGTPRRRRRLEVKDAFCPGNDGRVRSPPAVARTSQRLICLRGDDARLGLSRRVHVGSAPAGDASKSYARMPPPSRRPVPTAERHGAGDLLAPVARRIRARPSQPSASSRPSERGCRGLQRLMSEDEGHRPDDHRVP